MLDKVYIARHGFRLNWINSNWTSVTGLPRDPPLAAFGVKQAQELADYFLSLPETERPTAIFSSPYYRCLQTAEPVAVALQVPLYVEHGISEWYSPVVPQTGLHPRPGPAPSLSVFFPQIDPSYSSIWYPSRKGEDVGEVHDRVDGFLQHFVPAMDQSHHKNILLISHAATVITLARSLVGDRGLPLRVGCCSLTELDREGDDILGSWKASKLATGDHLSEGASRDWGFEDIEIANGRVVEDPGVPGTDNELDEPVGLVSQGQQQLQLSNL